MDLKENGYSSSRVTIQTDTDHEPPHKEHSRRYRCIQCGAFVAYDSDAVAQNGKQVHTFANPTGHVFQIKCFGEVHHTVQVGIESHTFSWFDGYNWIPSICIGCGLHVGWQFTDSQGVSPSFWALILNRLQNAS